MATSIRSIRSREAATRALSIAAVAPAQASRGPTRWVRRSTRWENRVVARGTFVSTYRILTVRRRRVQFLRS
ncbi:hypothetical protein ACRALDRAFT_2060779 [Sodiomyces alcalophilus JCM 7366]|uniref:uncharacterized protein n=1 Tax=Sodiomyces alcalophilus JCM 7366 TaxID=591952 RepID=UPI0039B6C610